MRNGRSRHIGTSAAALAFSLVAGLAAPALADGPPLIAQATAMEGPDVNLLSIEELANLEITSVSRRPESVAEAAAAVYVLRGEDIARSPASNLPEALRLAPNLQVQQIDSVNYAITARGFNSKETANKLLVMIDGRSIYTPLFSGVLWDSHDLPLGEIDRIEVISGPGGALYGANAVNGVINIVSRSAFDSQGTTIEAQAGPDDGRATFRHGGMWGDAAAFRVYVTGSSRRSSFLPTGAEANDGSVGVQAGFRTDWSSGANRFTLQGDLYDREVDGTVSGVGGDFRGGNLLGRWTREFDTGNSLEVQAYYDLTDREEDTGVNARTETWDIAIQHGFTPFANHAVVWGGGYQFIDDELISPPGAVAFLDPPQKDLYSINLFAQDQWSLNDDLTLTVGLKLETGSFRDIEPLPSLRIGWRASDQAFLWGAISRAVRVPSRIDRHLTFPGFLEGGGFQREELWAYELGYRGRPTANTSLSVSLFFNDYDDLRTADFTPGTFVPIRLANSARGQTWGAEIWGRWEVTPTWRLSAGLFAMEKDFEAKPGSRDITGVASQGDDPEYQATLRSQAELTETIALDVSLRAVDDLQRGTPSYVEADARIGWQLNAQIEFTLSGYNLLDERHFESDNAGVRREIGRTVHVGLRWRY